MSANLPFVLLCFFSGIAGAVAGAVLLWWRWGQRSGTPMADRRVDALCDKVDDLLHHQSRTPEPDVAAVPDEPLADVARAVRQALQVELASQSAHQVRRDQTLARQLAGLQTRLDRLDRLDAPPDAKPQAVREPPSQAVKSSSAPAVTARPPEAYPIPVVRPAPVALPEEPVRELSDEEIDAMPAELPPAAKPPKRILASPKAPVMRKL